MKTVHIDMSYIVASILVVKNKYYKESHCTFKECNDVINKLRKELYNVVINNYIDDRYFKICRNVIVLKEDIDLIDIIDRFQAYLPFKILSIIWNNEYIFKILENSRTVEKQGLNFIPSNIETIIEKIVEKPNKFYEKIAGELSHEEFLFISSLINEKSCSNCNNLSCRIPSAEKPIDDCISWRNPSLVGKTKLLRR